MNKSLKIFLSAVLVLVLLIGIVYALLNSPGAGDDLGLNQSTPLPTANPEFSNATDFLCDNKLVYRSVDDALLEPGKVCKLVLIGVDGVSSEIAQLVSLKHLYLLRTSLTEVPFAVFLPPSVTSLNISENPNITSLPPEIGQMEKLEILNISNTGITELPPEISELKNLITIITHEGQLTPQQNTVISEQQPSVVVNEIPVLEPPAER